MRSVRSKCQSLSGALASTNFNSIPKERDAMNHAIVQAVNAAAHSWGIEVLRYEIRDIIPPTSIKQAFWLD